MPINVYCTGHLNTFQDDKTKVIKTQINVPGGAKNKLPLLFSNIWEARATTETEQKYVILTRAEARGFQELRTTIPGLQPVVDVTVRDFKNPTKYGIGALLSGTQTRVPLETVKAAPSAAPPATVASAAAPRTAN